MVHHLASLLLILVAPSLSAASPGLPHGAVFPPPIFDKPGNLRPVRGGGPRGPVAPTAPSPGVAKPGLAAPAPGSSRNGKPGPLTGGGTPLDFSAWSWWWEFNKEPYLDVKGHLYESGPTSDGAGFFLGRGERRGNEQAPARPTPQLVGEVAIPALLDALARSEADALSSAILIALARIGATHPERSDEIADALANFLGHPSQELAETAVCALGILGNERSSLKLGEVLLDTADGREWVSAPNGIPWRTRAFAAFGIGILGHATENEDVRRLCVHRLAAALRADDTPTPDLAVACVSALGRIPLAYGPADALDGRDGTTLSHRQDQVRHLLRLVADSDADRHVRAHATTALARLLAVPGELVPRLLVREAVEVLDGVLARRSSAELEAACVQAFGLLVDADDDEVDVRARRRLLSIERSSRDRLARNLALISLARIGAKARVESDELEVLQTVRTHLLAQAARLGTARARWAALAIGVLGHARARRGERPHEALAGALLAGLSESSSPGDVGARAVACGMLGDPLLASPLHAKLLRTSDDRARGYLALGLGMLGAHDSLPELERIVRESTYRPDLLLEASLALGLLGGRGTSAALVERLHAATTLAVQASLARALGRIGDAAIVEPLARTLGDRGVSPLARSFAAAALGRVADTAVLPWNTIYSLDVAYGAATATLYDSAGFGILNLL